MKTMKNIAVLAVVLALLIAPAVTFADTGRQGKGNIYNFNPKRLVAKTASYTVTTSDSQIDVNGTGGAYTMTLPSVSDCMAGMRCEFKIKKTDASANVVTVTPATGDTVGGESTRKLVSQNAYMIIHAGPGRDWTVDFESPYTVEDYEAGTVDFAGLNSAELASDTTIIGTTPLLTIGDAGAEDAGIVFDGNAQDFYVGLDDSADDLIIGLGSAFGTTPAISVDENQVVTFAQDPIFGGTTPAVTVGDAGAEDAQINFDGNAQDFHIGLDDSADDLIIGVGTALGTTPAIKVDENAGVTIGGAVTDELTITAAIQGASPIVLDGATDNTNEITIAVTDPGADYTATIPAVADFTFAGVAGLASRVTTSTVTGNETLTTADCGKTFFIATDALTVTLPATSAGCILRFVNTGAAGNNIMTIDPNASDNIWGTFTLAASVVVSEGAAGVTIVNTKATSIKGDSVTLVGDGADGWFILNSTGIWAEGS